MFYLKTYFNFTKRQQLGVSLLLSIIIVLQCVYYFGDFSSIEKPFESNQLEAFEKELDSLRLVRLTTKPKVFSFNPNYISDFKGYTLGMSLKEIDRLHAYRKRNKWVNSAKEFQKITQVSDSLLKTISPYFKFPEWVTNPKPKKTFVSYTNYNKERSFSDKIDLNTATAKQLQQVNGIGEKLSARIIKFRNKFKGGFIADIQLQDIYGLKPEVIQRIMQQFTVKTPRAVIKIKLNSASVEELVTIQHIDYDLAYEIIDQRTLREKFNSINELTKVKGFPSEKIEIIKLYLTLD